MLNIALTLEHFENAFYHQALDKFDEQAFLDAGLPSWVRGRFQQIADHEATHVQLLSAALGDQATQPCTYDLCVRLFKIIYLPLILYVLAPSLIPRPSLL